MELIFLIFLVFLVGLPSLFVPWSLVDDGHAALVARKMTEFLASGDLTRFFSQMVEPSIGRFRPFYWFFQWVTFTVGGRSSFIHHFFHFAIFLVSVALLFKITQFITSSKKAAFLTGLFFAVNSFNVENWYRLGPQEVPLVFFLLAALYLLFCSSGKFCFLLSIFALFGFYFTKEVSLFFIPVSFLIWLAKKNHFKNRFFVFFLANLTFGILSRLLAEVLVGPGGYASFYQLNLQKMVWHSFLYFKLLLGGFGLLIAIAVFSFSIRFLTKLTSDRFWNDKIFLWQLVFISWFALFVLIQSPWAYVLGRYLLPGSIGLALFLGIEFSFLFDFLNKSIFGRDLKKDLNYLGRFLKFGIYLTFILTFFYQGLQIATYAVNSLAFYNRKMMSFLSTKVSQNGHVLFNLKKGEANLELFYEIPLHLDLFFGRKDIQVDHLDLEKKNFKEGDFMAKQQTLFIVSGTGASIYSEEKLLTQEEFLRVYQSKSKFYNLQFASPWVLIKGGLRNFPITPQKAERFLDRLPKVTFRENYWNIYQFEDSIL